MSCPHTIACSVTRRTRRGSTLVPLAQLSATSEVMLFSPDEGHCLRRRAFLMLGASFALGCASSGGTSAGASASRSAARRRDILTADEIAQAEYSNAYEAIERLRPHFLSSRNGYMPKLL